MVGNTGFAYADSRSDPLLIAADGQLCRAARRSTDGDLPTTGRALMLAKQRYYNSLAAGTLSNYDEKVLGEMMLYGLPMLKVSLPNQPQPPAPDRHQL